MSDLILSWGFLLGVLVGFVIEWNLSAWVFRRFATNLAPATRTIRKLSLEALLAFQEKIGAEIDRRRDLLR